MDNMTADIWNKVLHALKSRVPGPNFETWFRPLKLLRQEQSRLLVQAPNPLARDWIDNHYEGLFQEILKDLGEGALEVVLVDATQSGEDLQLSPPERGEAEQKKEFKKTRTYQAHLNPNYHFDRFVVGPSNRFAHAAALAVAQNPSNSYNPLYIYGGVGLGKTHLMQSIGNYIQENTSASKMTYLSAERFMNEMISAIAHRQQPVFRERYRQVDVLLLDDVHFLVGKTGTQEELFHTFNALYESQKQIVISSDCPPGQLQGIEERLKSRFQWGLIADIHPPELETKVAILHKKAEAYEVILPDDVALFIGTHMGSNIRELEGCLMRLIAFSSFKGQPITLDLAKQTFETLFKKEGRVTTVEAIQKYVATAYKLRVQDLKSKTNRADIVLPRQVCMFLCRELTGASLPEIGRRFGGKHHSTVLHSIRKVEDKMARDLTFQQQVQSFLNSFR